MHLLWGGEPPGSSSRRCLDICKEGRDTQSLLWPDDYRVQIDTSWEETPRDTHEMYTDEGIALLRRVERSPELARPGDYAGSIAGVYGGVGREYHRLRRRCGRLGSWEGSAEGSSARVPEEWGGAGGCAEISDEGAPSAPVVRRRSCLCADSARRVSMAISGANNEFLRDLYKELPSYCMFSGDEDLDDLLSSLEALTESHRSLSPRHPPVRRLVPS